MTSASQSNSNTDFSTSHQPHNQHQHQHQHQPQPQHQNQQQQQQQQQPQSHLDGNASHLGNNTSHGLGVSATSAADYTTDNHLAGLVQAATAAAGQDVGWAQNEDGDTAALMAGGHHGRAIQNQLDTYAAGMHLDDGGFGSPTANSQASQHHFNAIAPGTDNRQMGHANGLVGDGNEGSISRKRKRDVNVDPAMTAPFNAETGKSSGGGGGNSGGGRAPEKGGGSNENNGSSLDIRELPPQSALSDARAAGVHSAVALFRQPSATSKKYTRPPMSKMFTSLELSPENFLHLQAAAKGYMLDDDHPERRDCVGQRGRGDTEMVKLRLWNCVREFLAREGNGLRFFGENVVNEGVGPRSMIWPRDDQRIISLVMPLLRRMVTNERQRQYAIETRKGGSADDKKKKQGSEGVSKLASDSVQRFHQPPPDDGTQLGMLEVINEYPGYPTDWASVAQVYDLYNQDYRLDNLGSISGLVQQDWWGIIAAIDCHYQIDHNGDATQCAESCVECSVNHIVSSESATHASWRIGGDADDIAARNYFASGITRDATHHIRDTLLSRSATQGQPQHPPLHSPSAPVHKVHDTESYHSQTPTFPSNSPALQQPHHPESQSGEQHQHQQHQSQQQHPQAQAQDDGLPVTIAINIIQDREHIRILPRFDLPARQCTDFSTLLSKIRQYYQQSQQQHQGGHNNCQLSSNMRVRVWTDEGLSPVNNDTEWMVALVTASEIEWMDQELRVIVDRVGAHQNTNNNDDNGNASYLVDDS